MSRAVCLAAVVLISACGKSAKDTCASIELGTPLNEIPNAREKACIGGALQELHGPVSALKCCNRSNSLDAGVVADAGCGVDCASPEFGSFREYQVGDTEYLDGDPMNPRWCCILVRDEKVVGRAVGFD